MKDASKRLRRVDTDDDEEEEKRSTNLTGKPKRRKLRKRHSSCSPEEDFIDGFVIASYSSLHSLEVVGTSKPTSPSHLGFKEENGKPKSPSKMFENGNEQPKTLRERKKVEVSDVETSKNRKRKTFDNEDPELEKPLSSLLRPSSGQLTDDSSESGNSEKGYICDGESEDEQGSDKEKKKPVLKDSEIVIEIKSPKSVQSENEQMLKDEKMSPVTFLSQRTTSSPISLPNPLKPSLSRVTSSSSLVFPRYSRPVAPQTSWLHQFSPSFQKPSAVMDARRVPGSYTGADALHQELNNRFLTSHSGKGQEMHQHSHLHHHQHQHQHQHQHTHFYPTPLMASAGIFSAGTNPPGMSPFTTPIPSYGSHAVPPYNKKTGKWCSAHGQIAWKIYYHQQRVQTEMSKDPHVKPEQVSIVKSSTAIVPPFSPRRVSPGCHSPYLHPSRYPSSPFSKPTAFGGHRNSSPYGLATTASSSAFSSVVAPSVPRRSSSPLLAVNPTSVGVLSSSELVKRSSSVVGSSSLYPWLKSETKEASSERRDRVESDPTKSEVQRRSPTRQVQNFSIQSLGGERTEILRPGPLSVHNSTRSPVPREPRPLEARSAYMEDKNVSTLNSFDKRPFDYRANIDLNRNALYPRLDPMMAAHSPHMTALTPPIGLGYVYQGGPYVPDSMYHTPLSHGMFLGAPHDPLSSMGRSHDMAFYRRRENLDDRDR